MHRDRGASLVEYALIAAACAAVLTATTVSLRDDIRGQFDHVTATPTPTAWTPARDPTPPADPPAADPTGVPEMCTWTVDDDGDQEPDPEETTIATGPCD